MADQTSDDEIEEMQEELGDYSDEEDEEVPENLNDDDINEGENANAEEKDEEKSEDGDEDDDEETEVKTNGKTILPDLFPKTTQNEFIKMIQTLSHILDESTLLLTKKEIKKTLGKTGMSPEMAYNIFNDADIEIPCKIVRFNQAYEDLFIDPRKYPTNDQLYTRDLDSDEPSYTQRIFTKDFN